MKQPEVLFLSPACTGGLGGLIPFCSRI